MGSENRPASLLRNEIAGIPVAELAQRFGTPTYIYDADRIRDQISRLSDFDVIRYAQKANSNLAILDMCRRAGVVLDATSSGEIHRALRAGYASSGDPAPIVYTADIFDREALAIVGDHAIVANDAITSRSLAIVGDRLAIDAILAIMETSATSPALHP